MNKASMIETIEANILRIRVDYRGGGVEIDLTPFGYENEKMTAYQNYLGGGMLSSIGNDCTISTWKSDPELLEIANQLSRYYHEQTNELHDEWSASDFESVQKRPLSAY